MTKENLITPILLIGLSLAFITVSFLVTVFFRNPKLIKAKLRIGALIISLTAFANTYSFSQKTCYKSTVVQEEKITLDAQNESQTISISEEIKVLTGKIENLGSIQYYYCITDTLGKHIQKGLLKATDGKFDGDEEIFEIHLSKLSPGSFVLKVYSSKDRMASDYFTYKAALIVREKLDPTKVTCYYY